jgi:hypothetical protein
MIDICIVAWPNHPARMEYFRQMWASLKRYLSASRHVLRYWCSSESERDPAAPWCGGELQDFCRREAITLSSRPAPASLGANMNGALRLGSAEHVLLVQDDFELRAPCDLSAGVGLLQAHPEVDLIRYSWPPMTRFVGQIDGWPLVDIDGDWPYGDEPQLRRRDFSDKWGWYTEGGRHACSEADMLWQLVNHGAVIVAADQNYFGNCGAVSAVPADREFRCREITR